MTTRNWSSAELAQRSGVSIGTIGNLLNGRTIKPHTKTTHALARAFGVATDALERQLVTASQQRHEALIHAVESLTPRQYQHLVRFLRSFHTAAGRRRR